MIAWLFPGQGSQRAGMAAELPACEELFASGRAVLGADLRRICTSSSVDAWPAELLQPALYLTCVGAAGALLDRGLRPDAVAGHSLGELAALTAAGSLSFEDGIRLVALRGRATAAAARANPGGMAAVIGLQPGTIEDICERTGRVWVANLNAPKQTVISGADDALVAAAEACRAAGAVRVVRLQVPIPAHTPLMEPARAELEEAAAGVTLHEPSCPFYSGVDASPHTESEDIRRLLVQALVVPVRFADALRAMQEGGVTGYVEVGPGRVLVGLVRQTLTGASLASVGTEGEAEALAFSAPVDSANGARPAAPIRLGGTATAAAKGGMA